MSTNPFSELTFFRRFQRSNPNNGSDSDKEEEPAEAFTMNSDVLKANPYYAVNGIDCETTSDAKQKAQCNFHNTTDSLAALEKERANGDGQYTDEFLKFGKIQMQTAQLWIGIAGMVYLLYRNE